MKAPKAPIVASIALAISLAAANLASAQTVVKETVTTSSAGTISEFSPSMIMLRSDSTALPVRYYYSGATTYVDETGAPIAVQTIGSGTPVTVYYHRLGHRNVVSRVVVRRPVQTTTTTTTTVEETRR